jgi:RHH-type rel operon transcriptional repressor/antitoxin RelB
MYDKIFLRRKVMATLIIPTDLDKRLAILAEKAHISKDDYAIQALEEFLEDQEDYLIALARSERIDKGIDTPLSLEEALKELGLEKEDLH